MTTETDNHSQTPESEQISGAEALIRALLDEGIDTVFGYPGGQVISIYDELYRYSDRLRHILTRHEQGAIHAAQGYARATGKIGVVIATSGPGATNLVTGLADAQFDSTPVVCITGQVTKNLGEVGLFQDANTISIAYADITKWCYQITEDDDITTVVSKACRIAQTERPGPVLINFPADLQAKRKFLEDGKEDKEIIEELEEKIEDEKEVKEIIEELEGKIEELEGKIKELYKKMTGNKKKISKFGKSKLIYEKIKLENEKIKLENEKIKLENEKIKLENAANTINNAKRPLVLVGQGVTLAHAEEELMQFLEKADLPAASTLMGLSVLPTEHRLNMGMLGMHGNLAPNIKARTECDVLVAVGMRFSSRIVEDAKTYAPQAKVIHLEVDPAEINRNIAADIPVLGSVKRTLPLLTEKLEKRDRGAWIGSFDEWKQFEDRKVVQPQMHPAPGSPITMGEVVEAFGNIDKGESIVVTDVGQHQMIAARYSRTNHPRSFITSGGLGTMGFGLPAAIGAKTGCPGRSVVLFAGDGGFQMTIQELGTILQYRIPVKMVLLNNTFLGMVRQWQELFYEKRYAFTELQNPDFMQIARAYGIPSRRVTSREELPEAMQALYDSPDAFLLEVAVEKEGLVFPMMKGDKFYCPEEVK